MPRERKSTMVEFVIELEKLYAVETIPQVKTGLMQMIREAKRGEFHDYKNQKYICGKIAASQGLRNLGFVALAKDIENGVYDEEADAEDVKRMTGHLMEAGLKEDHPIFDKLRL